MQNQTEPPGATARWATRTVDARPPNVGATRRLRAALRHVGLTIAGRLARSGEPPSLRCLFAHHVFDDEVACFRRSLSRLQAIGEFIGTAEVLEIARGNRPVSCPLFHLSFDDGFDNLYRNALPVLTDLGIPCAVFVPTRFMGASDADVLSRWWKPEAASCPTRPLRWEWIREMAELGHEFGSHTRTHARVSQVADDRERLHDEIVGSKEDLEQRLGRPCRYFAWPYGTLSDVDARGLAAIEQAGYEGCFSGVRGRVIPGRSSSFCLPRHHFEPEWPWSHVRFFALGGREIEP